MIVASIHGEIELHYKYKISYDKAWVASKMCLRISLVHMRSHLKKNIKVVGNKRIKSRMVVDYKHKGNLNDSTIVSERFFGHLNYVLKVTNTISH